MSFPPERESGEEEQVRETLAFQWKQFEEEYAQVPEEELDERFSRFILIESSGDETIH
jgi:predicted ArsR family transcriptional regulator